jgi:hypothetical protein
MQAPSFMCSATSRPVLRDLEESASVPFLDVKQMNGKVLQWEK